jgi:hypothetical protein
LNSYNSPFSKTIPRFNSGRFAAFLALFSVGWGFCTIRVAAPEWTRRNTQPDWADRYGSRIMNHRLPTSQEQRPTVSSVVDNSEELVF